MFSPKAGTSKIQIGASTRTFSLSEYPRIEKLDPAFRPRKRSPLLAVAVIGLCIPLPRHRPLSRPTTRRRSFKKPGGGCLYNAQMAGDMNVVIVGWSDTAIYTAPRSEPVRILQNLASSEMRAKPALLSTDNLVSAKYTLVRSNPCCAPISGSCRFSF
jgi:hypothetical protein